MKDYLALHFLDLFNFTTLSVMPSIMIVMLTAVAVVYNHYFTKNNKRSGFMVLACVSSVFSILTNNLIVLFIGIECLSIFCFALVFLSNSVKRVFALSYFLIHALAGILLMVFIILYYNNNNSFTIAPLNNLYSLESFFIISAFIINIAALPFLGWYIKAYSRLDSFSLILLATITTKTSFFALWNIVSGSNILFEIGLLTALIATFLALVSNNVIKFLLYVSVVSVGFCVMSVSYSGLLAAENLSMEVNYQIAWYMLSIVFTITGFLTIYGFISNNEVKDYSFSQIKHYFREHGSSIHFIILVIIFGLYLSAFPFTTSFGVKSEITKLFVGNALFYKILKVLGVVFIMFSIKLIAPVCHSIEFFKLDKEGKKLIYILYFIAFILFTINVFFIIQSEVKYTLFSASVDFFNFIAYSFFASVLLWFLSFIFKKVKINNIIRFTVRNIRNLRTNIKIKITKIINFNYFPTFDLKKIKQLLVYSKSSISTTLMLIIFFISIFLFKT